MLDLLPPFAADWIMQHPQRELAALVCICLSIWATFSIDCGVEADGSPENGNGN